MIPVPQIPPGEPVRVSASLYTTFLRCPANALAQLQGLYGPETRASFSGILAHRIFARHLNMGAIDPNEFETACRQEIGQALNVKLGSLQLRPSELRTVIAEVGELYERFQLISVAGCRSVEQELEVALTADVTLRGRIDAVFDDARGVRLVDWKTGALGEVQAQLDFYALIWALHHGELPAAVEAASVSSGERYEHVPSPAAATATGRRVAELVAAMRLGFGDEAAVLRRGGPGCRYCPLAQDCTEGATALRVLSA